MAHFVLATALSANNQEDEALSEYRRAVELTPTNPKFLDHLAMSLALNGNQQEAIAQIQKAIAIDPKSIEYRFNFGYLLESQGMFAEAVPALEQAVAISKGRDWRCLAELARVYDKTGSASEAAKALRRAIEAAARQSNQAAVKTLQDALDSYHPAGGTKSD